MDGTTSEIQPIHLLTFALPALSLLFAAVFTLLWRQWRQNSYLLYLAAAFFLHAGGVLSQLFHFPQDMGLNALFSCGVYSLAVLLFVHGCLRRVHDKLPRSIAVVSFLLLMAAIAYFSYVRDDLRFRIYVLNFGYGALFLLLAFRLFRASVKPLDKAFTWLSLGVGIEFFVRTALTASKIDAHSTIPLFARSPFWIWLTLSSLVLVALLGITLLVGILLDMVEHFRQESQLDSLTGLLNRRGFEEAAQARLREKGVAPVSLIVFDVDHFKSINDTYGHSMGDRVLQGIAGTLREHISREDAVGRIGGEEFAILLARASQLEAFSAAEQLRGALENQRFGEDNPVREKITASFGVAEYAPGQSLREMMETADRGLYEAKRNGRNQVSVVEPAS